MMQRPNEQDTPDSVLSGSCRWQLRRQARRNKQDTALPAELKHKWLECPLWDSGNMCAANTLSQWSCYARFPSSPSDTVCSCRIPRSLESVI